MEKKDYTALDVQILKSIEGGATKFIDILHFGHSGKEFTERDTDRRLQALRKKGLIEFHKRGIGWKLATPKKVKKVMP